MTAESPFFEGDVVAEKYRIVRTLGSGGMGMVFAADHLDLERQVALKVMVRSEDSNDDAVARFLREAKAAARLNSQHVAKVLDTGRLESGVPYLVMELLEGQNLQDLIAKQGPMSATFAVDIMLEACEALAEAHGAGIVHRDLKPANLFLANDAYGGRILKLLDFGISKMQVGGLGPDLKLTDSHSMMGSPVYMSPEQIRSARTVDHRSDIWSLGAVLFELVTGRVVWPGLTLGDVFIQIENEPAPNARSVMPSLSIELDAIISRCLDKNPARRYQHMADLALALAPLGSKRARATLERVLRISGQGNQHTVTTAVGSTNVGASSDVSVLPTLVALTNTVEPVHLDTTYGASAIARLGARAVTSGADNPQRESIQSAAGSASERGIAGETRRPSSGRTLRIVLASAAGVILIAAAIFTARHRSVESDLLAKPLESRSARVLGTHGSTTLVRPLEAPAAASAAAMSSASTIPSAPPAKPTVSPSVIARPQLRRASLTAKGNTANGPAASGKPAADPKPAPSSDSVNRTTDPMSVRR